MAGQDGGGIGHCGNATEREMVLNSPRSAPSVLVCQLIVPLHAAMRRACDFMDAGMAAVTTRTLLLLPAARGHQQECMQTMYNHDPAWALLYNLQQLRMSHHSTLRAFSHCSSAPVQITDP